MNREKLRRAIDNYPETMTQAERIETYAAGGETDHIPFTIQTNEEAFADIFGYTTAQWRDDPDVHIDIIRRRRDEFGISGLTCGLRLRTLAQSVGTEIFFPEIGIDRIEKAVLTDLNDLPGLLRNNPYTNPVLLSILERAKRLKDAFPDMTIATSVAGPVTNASCIRPIELMLRDLIKHPEEMNDLLSFCVDQSLAWADMFTKEFGSVSSNIADPVSCAEILGRKHYRKYAEPHLRTLIAGLTEITGRKPSLHICGKTSPLWNEMKELPVSEFSVDNLESLEQARDIMGPHFSLAGNVAPVETLLNGTPEDVIRACVDCLAKGSDSPNGYTLATGCQTPIGTKAENIYAFIYAARRYGRGASKGSLPQGLQDPLTFPLEF